MTVVPLRIVLIGTSSSGRRGLLNALLDKPYDAQADDVGDYSFDDMHQTQLTLKSSKNTVVDLTICSPFWPGFSDNPDSTQLGFAGLTYAFADGYLLVYSINDSSRFTFDEWIPKHVEFARVSKVRNDNNFGVEHGLQMSPPEYEPDSEANLVFRRTFPFAVVATKRDKDEDKRTIGSDEGQRFAATFDAQYFEVSTLLDDRQSIVDIFEHLIGKILQYRSSSSSSSSNRTIIRRTCCVLL